MSEKKLSLVVELINKTEAEFRKISGEMDAMSAQTAKTREALMKIGAVSGVAFAGLSAGIVNSVSEFGAFNSEIQRAGAFVSATADELAVFRKAAIDAAQGTAYSATQAAKALQNFVGGEISAAEASANLGTVIDLAVVGKMGDLQQAVDIGSLALTVFSKDAMEMTDVIDIIATVAADVTTQTDQWSTALNASAGSAKGAGLSFKELNILFAQLKRGGASINLMSSAVNSAMLKIQNPTDTARTALEKVGLSVKGLKTSLQDGPVELLQYLKKGFDEAQKSGQGMKFLVDAIGQQAAPEFALALGQTNEALAETGGWFDNIEGRGQKLAADLRSAEPPLQQLSGAFVEMRLAVGGALAPAFNSLVAVLVPVIEKVNKFVQANPKLIGGLVLAAAAVAGIVAALSGLTLVMFAVVSAIPIFITGVGAIAGAFVVAAKAAVGFFIALGPISLAILGVSVVVSTIIFQFQKFGNITDALKYTMLMFGKMTLNVIKTIFDSVFGLIMLIPGLGTAFTKASESIGRGIKSIESEMGRMNDSTKESLQEMVDGLTDVEAATNNMSKASSAMSLKVAGTLSSLRGEYVKYKLTGVDALDKLREATIQLAITNGVLAPSIDNLLNGTQRVTNAVNSWSLGTTKLEETVSTSMTNISDDIEESTTKSDSAFKRLVDSVKQVRDEVIATYREIQDANDNYLGNVADSEQSYRNDIVGIVAKAESEIRDIEKKIRKAKKDDDSGDEVSKLQDELEQKKAIISSYNELDLDLGRQIAEEKKRLQMDEIERLTFDHTKKLQMIQVEYLEGQLKRLQKLSDLKAEEQLVVESLGIQKMAAINADLEKSKSFRETLASQKVGLTSWMAETQAMYASYVSNVQSTMSRIGSSSKTTISTSSKRTTGGRASGGGVQPGRTFMVGERGPELFTPEQYGTIKANGSSNGGVTIIIRDNFFTDDKYERKITDNIVRNLKQTMRLSI